MERYEPAFKHHEETNQIEVYLCAQLHYALYVSAWRAVATCLDQGERMPLVESDALLHYISLTTIQSPPASYIASPEHWQILARTLADHLTILPEDQAAAGTTFSRRIDNELAVAAFRVAMDHEAEFFVDPIIPNVLPPDFE